MRRPSLGEGLVRIVNAYRTRALGLELLAKQTTDADLKWRLNDLAQACVDLADAIERHPEVGELEELERPRRLH